MAVAMIGPLAVNADLARTYILANGNSRAKARLAGILQGSKAEPAVVQELEALQKGDGSFSIPPGMCVSGSLATTCRILSECLEMPPLSGSPMVSRALAFLRRSQQRDGSWLEPGRLSSLYLTAWVTFTLAGLDPDHQDPIRRGGMAVNRLLKEAEEAPLGQAPSPETLALAWALGCMPGGTGSLRSASCFEHLIERLQSTRDVSQFLTFALAAEAGGPFLLPIARQLAVLASSQQEDGSWRWPEGDAVEATLAAVRIFSGYGIMGVTA